MPPRLSRCLALPISRALTISYPYSTLPYSSIEMRSKYFVYESLLGFAFDEDEQPGHVVIFLRDVRRNDSSPKVGRGCNPPTNWRVQPNQAALIACCRPQDRLRAHLQARNDQATMTIAWIGLLAF